MNFMILLKLFYDDSKKKQARINAAEFIQIDWGVIGPRSSEETPAIMESLSDHLGSGCDLL
jgi:hypothetical protein